MPFEPEFTRTTGRRSDPTGLIGAPVARLGTVARTREPGRFLVRNERRGVPRDRGGRSMAGEDVFEYRCCGVVQVFGGGEQHRAALDGLPS